VEADGEGAVSGATGSGSRAQAACSQSAATTRVT